MSKVEYKHIDLAGATLVQRRHKRQITPPGMLSVTNLLQSPSDGSLVMRPDFDQYEDDIRALSGWESGVITQNFDQTLDILNSAAGLYGSSRIIYFTTYAPYGYYATNGEPQFLSDTYAVGQVLGTNGSYDVSFYAVGADAGDINLKKKTWRGAILEINGDGKYYLVDRITAASASAETATVRLRSPLTSEYAGTIDLLGALYKWTQIGATAVYYLEAADDSGAPPNITVHPAQVLLDGSAATEGTAGSLNDHEWDWVDGAAQEALGYDTIYFRDDTGDPDVSGITLASNGVSYALWFNHNCYRATDTKLLIQTGDSSSATSLIYCAPTFKDKFSSADISGPFYTNVTEGPWTYSGITYSDATDNIDNVDGEDLTFATNGTSWIQVSGSTTPATTALYSVTTNIETDDAWTRYDLASATWTIPQPSTDDVISAIALHDIQRNPTKGFICGCTVSATSVLGADWSRPGVAWTTNGSTWTVVVDDSYSFSDGWKGLGAWHDGTTLTAIFRDSTDGGDNDTYNIRYSTDNGTNWSNTTGTNSFNATGDKSDTKLKFGESTNPFVICGGNENLYYSTDGQAFSTKDVSGDVTLDTVSNIAYNNGDGGTAYWVVIGFNAGASVIARAPTTINGTYVDVTPSFELTTGNAVTCVFYDPIGGRFLALDDADYNGISYLYVSADYGANWTSHAMSQFGATDTAPTNLDWSGQLLACNFGNQYTVLDRGYTAVHDSDLFRPLSDLYRSTSVSTLDGYTVLVGTSEWDTGTEEFIYYPRRIRWTSPGTFNDFTSTGTGTADLKGTGSLLYSLVVNGRIVIFETNTVGALVPRGDTSDPWDYDVISDNFKVLSNPIAVGDSIFVVGFDGLLYSCDGIEAPREVGASFDLTKFDDFDQTKPAWLAYAREFNSLLCYYRDSESSTHLAQLINIGNGGVSEVSLLETGDTSAKSDQPISVVAIEDADKRRTLVSYPPNSSDTDTLIVAKLSSNEKVTGTDTVTTFGATYSAKWSSLAEFGELYITQEGNKASLKHLIAETYTTATKGDNTDRPYLVADVKSIEDSDYATSGDSVGTATMTTTALTGSGTAWSNTIVVGTAAAGEVGPYTLPCLGSQARLYKDSTLLVETTDYTVSGKTVTLTTDLGNGEVLYAYWENYPEIKVKVGDFFKSASDWHRVTSVTNSTTIVCDHYLSSGSETVTHYPAWQLDDDHGRIEIGINRLVEGVQIRLYLIPDYNGTQQSTVAKITGLSIGYVPQGRKIVKATGS
jgi:hypothetical protein